VGLDEAAIAELLARSVALQSVPEAAAPRAAGVMP
jgi:hypothetical protein